MSAELFHADCFDILPNIPDNGVNHVIMDPPYESDMHETKSGALGLRIDGAKPLGALDFASIDGIRGKTVHEAARVASGWMAIFCTPEGVAAWRDEIELAGVKYKRACVWVKPDAAPQFNGQGPAMGAEMIVTAWAGSGHSRWNGGGRRGVFTHNTNSKDRHGTHPTEKPLALMMELISLFTNPDDVILDPFMGSGTTGIACVRLGRRFIGIERDKKYFQIAKERIELTERQNDFLVPREARKKNAKLF